MNAAKKMCLVCMDRTGSNMISSRLNTHPEIQFYNEVFHRQYVIFQDDRVNGDIDFVSRRDRNPEAFVGQIWAGAFESEPTRSATNGYGFKIFVNHNARALRFITNSDAKIIFLRRRNPLLRYSSFKIASVTGEWKSTKDKKSNKKVAFQPTEFRAYYQNYESLETLYEMTLTRWNRPYFQVYYEDIIKREEVWNDLVGYLGYAPADFKQSSLVRQNSSDVLGRFSNPEVVEEFVAKLGAYDWLTE